MTVEQRDYLLRVDKPIGPTSHDIVAIARRLLSTRRVGHTGTLDPFASGLMLLCVNRATRIAEFLTGMDKVYHASARLDAFTDTDDHTGEPIADNEEWRSLDRAMIEAAMRKLTGPIQQVPPAYSAKKKDGERLYRLARRGEVVTPDPVSVKVSTFKLTSIDLPAIEFEVACSSGTYVRALARDLGRALGTGGYLTALRRTQVGWFDVKDAVTVERLADPAARKRAEFTMLDGLAELPRVDVNAETAAQLRQGKTITDPAEHEEQSTVVVASEDELVAVARADSGLLRPFKVWSDHGE
jgi:tRNA pseudouridine55 synthase